MENGKVAGLHIQNCDKANRHFQNKRLVRKDLENWGSLVKIASPYLVYS